MKLTQCPKCEYKQAAAEQCANCGLVFRKYFKYHPQHTSAEIAEFDPDKKSVVTPSDLIRSNQTTPNNFRLVKFAFIALLFFTTGQMLRRY
jgi:primosomal protein N'